MSTRVLFAIHGIIFTGLSILAVFSGGTGGGGDSIGHYFFAEIVWREPVFLLDLWAKPVFTLVASPFAQLGFTALKIFNIFCGVASSLVASLVARQLGKPWFWAIPFLAFIAPAFYTYLFSGLTEPFAALVTISAIWLCLTGRVSAGFVLASFLPFCRTEAQVFLLFFAAYGVFNGNFKKLPLLLTGYIIYSLVGWLVFGNALWVFDSPYNSGGSVYGKGEWHHYLGQLKGMLAVPGLVLGALGIVQLILNLFQGKLRWKRELLLVHSIFFALLVGHSAVWALGIYGSAGLGRTLLTGFPLLWIIMLDGLILVKNLSARLFRGHAYILPLIWLVWQGGTTLKNPITYYYYHNHLEETPNNQFFRDSVAPYIRQNFPEAGHYVFGDPYMAIPLGINFKDDQVSSPWAAFRNPESLPPETVLIYESQYAPVQYGIHLEDLQKSPYVKEIESWESPQGLLYALFITRDYDP